MLTEKQIESIKTVGQLKASGWKSRSVKQEMRENLMRMLETEKPLFEGIYGYDQTVIPQLVNAILARHDILLLGLRGQAKTRILRSLHRFLDPWMPAVQGAPLLDDPFHPVSRAAREMTFTLGDETPIVWIPSRERYVEKLATPDTTVADLIGDIDPIKAASRKLELADEQVIHFGLIPRANRCIFVINELPDLQPRIQVALLNIMQERDIQIRGFNVRIPLDVAIHFSANPEDYTNRGNIITPLKDRIDAQIITHYPKDVETGVRITAQESWKARGAVDVSVPAVLAEIVEHIAIAARASEFVDQKSGVSARLTISCMEFLVSQAEQRAIRHKEKTATARLTDLFNLIPAITGKIELVYEGEQEGPQKVAIHIIGKAIESVFNQCFPKPRKRTKQAGADPYQAVLAWFSGGNHLAISSDMNDVSFWKALQAVPGLETGAAISKRAEAEKGSVWMELVLEGLHQHSFLSRELTAEGPSYGDLAGSVLGNILSGADSSIDSE